MGSSAPNRSRSDQERDIMKRMRKASRDEEISLYGRPCLMRPMKTPNSKRWSRAWRRIKIEDE